MSFLSATFFLDIPLDYSCCSFTQGYPPDCIPRAWDPRFHSKIILFPGASISTLNFRARQSLNRYQRLLGKIKFTLFKFVEGSGMVLFTITISLDNARITHIYLYHDYKVIFLGQKK